MASHDKLMSVAVRTSAGKLEIDPPRTLFTMRVDCAIVEDNCFDVFPDGNRFLVVDPVGPPGVGHAGAKLDGGVEETTLTSLYTLYQSGYTFHIFSL